MSKEAKNAIFNSFPKPCRWLKIYFYAALPILMLLSLVDLPIIVQYFSDIIRDPWRIPSFLWGLDYETASSVMPLFTTYCMSSVAALIMGVASFTCFLCLNSHTYIVNNVFLALFLYKRIVYSVIISNMSSGIIFFDDILYLVAVIGFVVFNYIYFKKRKELFRILSGNTPAKSESKANDVISSNGENSNAISESTIEENLDEVENNNTNNSDIKKEQETASEDIKYHLSKRGEDIAPVKGWTIYGKDVLVKNRKTGDDIAPISEVEENNILDVKGKDLDKEVENLLSIIGSDAVLMLDGQIMDEETREIFAMNLKMR